MNAGHKGPALIDFDLSMLETDDCFNHHAAESSSFEGTGESITALIYILNLG